MSLSPVPCSSCPSWSRSILLALVGLALCAPAYGQPATEPPAEQDGLSGEASLNFLVGVPRGAFQDNIDGLGYGGELFVGLRLGNTPAVVGVDLGFLIYGRHTDTVPFSNTVGPRVTVDVTTTNNIFEPHLVLRLQSPGGRVRPYVEGLFGLKYLFTETRVENENRSDDEEEIASTTNFSDVALSGGVGGGVDIQVYRPAEKDVRGVSVHLGLQYLAGQRAEYLAEGALEDTNRNGRLDDSELPVRRSVTTLLQPRVGVSLQF